MSQYHFQLIGRLVQKDAETGDAITDQVITEHALPEEMVEVEWVEKLVLEATNDVRRQSFFKILAHYDAQLSGRRQHVTEHCEVIFAGKKGLEIASLVGRDVVHRQRCLCKTCKQTFVPFHEMVPSTSHIYITESLRERSCDLVKDCTYSQSHEFVQSETGDAETLCRRELRNLVEKEGERIRRQEMVEARMALHEHRIDVDEIEALLSNRIEPSEASGAVPGICTPPLPEAQEGAAAFGHDPTTTREIEANAVKGSLDGVVVRRPEKRTWLELCVADVRDQAGHQIKAISDADWTSLTIKLLAVLLGWAGADTPIVLFVDGAPVLKHILEILRGLFKEAYLILDWYHLVKKCKQRLSLACYGSTHRKQWLRILMPLLWEGKVAHAIWQLRKLRKEARNPEQVDKLIDYLVRNQAFIPNYKRRKELGLTNGSHRAEKACDLLVSKRMKHAGMHWREEGSDAVLALRTVHRNGEWDRYFPKAVGF